MCIKRDLIIGNLQHHDKRLHLLKKHYNYIKKEVKTLKSHIFILVNEINNTTDCSIKKNKREELNFLQYLVATRSKELLNINSDILMEEVFLAERHSELEKLENFQKNKQ